MVQKVETILCDLRQYHEWMDEELFESLQRLATRLRGLKVGHVNATSRGVGWQKS